MSTREEREHREAVECLLNEIRVGVQWLVGIGAVLVTHTLLAYIIGCCQG